MLDEPTNDLDIESLELLEQTLQDYPGTLLLVSHDRAFLDNVVTQSLVAEGDGRWREFVGGYSDWLSQRAAMQAAAGTAAGGNTVSKSEAGGGASGGIAKSAGRRKMSFKEIRELELLPAQIESLEAEQSTIHQAMAGNAYHKKAADEKRREQSRLADIETQLAAAYARWELLEAQRIASV